MELVEKKTVLWICSQNVKGVGVSGPHVLLFCWTFTPSYSVFQSISSLVQMVGLKGFFGGVMFISKNDRKSEAGTPRHLEHQLQHTQQASEEVMWQCDALDHFFGQYVCQDVVYNFVK